MKIEKINDNKIRCTLTSADLAERNLKLGLMLKMILLKKDLNLICLRTLIQVKLLKNF